MMSMEEMLKGKRITVFLQNGLSYTGEFAEHGADVIWLKDAVRIVELEDGVADDDDDDDDDDILGPPDPKDRYEPTSALQECVDNVFLTIHSILSIEMNDEKEEKDDEVKA